MGRKLGCNVVRYNGSMNWRESTKFRCLDDESVTLDRYRGICFFSLEHRKPSGIARLELRKIDILFVHSGFM